MLIVIVGAGASFDCELPNVDRRTDPFARMPLVDGLFDDRPYNDDALMKYPSARGIFQELKDIVVNEHNQETIEEVLSRFSREADKNPRRPNQLLVMRFYLKEIIQNQSNEIGRLHGGRTNYVALVNKLHDWSIKNNDRVCIINFNYDLLLENALESAAIKWRVYSFTDYFTRDDFIVVKPHGSVDWVRWCRPVPNNITLTEFQTIKNAQISNQPADDLIDSATGLDIKASQIHLMSEPVIDDMVTIPALAVPTKGKNFEYPLQYLKQIENWMQQATLMMTIGWRGAETHFLEYLKYTPDNMPLISVNHSIEGCSEVQENMKPYMDFEPQQFDNGFSNFVNGPEIKTFLGL